MYYHYVQVNDGLQYEDNTQQLRDRSERPIVSKLL